MAASDRGAKAEGEFERVLRGRLLRTVFQPIVRVESGAVVGYEGLIRGPAGSILESPDALIKEAYRQNRVAEFDWLARASASRAALRSRLAPDDLLFLNIEPVALASNCPPDLLRDIEEAFGRYRIVLEITERSLDHDSRPPPTTPPPAPAGRRRAAPRPPPPPRPGGGGGGGVLKGRCPCFRSSGR